MALDTLEAGLRPGEHLTEIEESEAIAVPLSALEAQTRGEIDIQIATANKYRRSLQKSLQDALTMATLDEETAERCFYVLPRGRQTIDGPSARLAEIMASAWGNMRVEGRIVGEDDKFITVRGVAWDLQSNVAVATEVRRRITDKYGRKYSDDMIVMTANAAISIAIRNAVFKVIPNAYTRKIFETCKKVATGDAKTLATKRKETLDALQKLGATRERVFAALQIKGEEDIDLDLLMVLKGMGTAIREGSTSVDEAFPDPQANGNGEKGVEALKGRIKGKSESSGDTAAPDAAAIPPEPPAGTEPPDLNL